jgi:hypothetical protein
MRFPIILGVTLSAGAFLDERPAVGASGGKKGHI